MQLDRMKITSGSKGFSIIRNESSDSDIAVEFFGVTKRFRTYTSQKERLLSLFSKRYRRAIKTNLVLDNLSFTVNKGQAVNVVGLSNSGKTTLLNLISGLALPSNGKIVINGGVDVFSTTMSGLDPNLTARKSLFVRARMIGLSKTQIKEVIPKAIEFSELGSLIDKPIKQLTKQQKFRIVPSLILNLDYNILLIDTWVVGVDEEFKAKCADRLKELIRDDTTTILFCSMYEAAKTWGFDHTLALKNGRIVYDGKTSETKGAFKKKSTDKEDRKKKYNHFL